MSNRFDSRNRNDGQNYKNSAKPQKKFIPKRDPQNSSQQQTLSNSLRAASALPATTLGSGRGGGDGGGNGSGANAEAASMSRVRVGENGDWVKTPPGGRFVDYLPQDEAVATGLGADEGGLDPLESQRVVDLLNRELSRLLKLTPRDFWKEVASDVSLHKFLESFLKFRSRWYDFPYRGVRGIVAGVIVGEFDLCRRVFMVLYRISCNRDPEAKAADALSPKDHAALLQDKKLLDLPKLLDICAIYGHENEDLTKILVTNSMKAQASVQNDLPAVASHFLNIVQTMYQRCSSSLEVLLSSGGGRDVGSNHLHSDYLEVMDFVNDAVVSMDSFVTAYKPAAVFFTSPVEMSSGNEELLTTLARLHDSLLHSLWRGFNILFAAEDGHRETASDLLSNVFISLDMLSRRIAKFGWNVLYYCYLSDEIFEGSYSLPDAMKMFPANVEDPAIRADILIQALRDLSENYSHISDGRSGVTFLQKVEKNHMIMSRIEFLQNSGWMLIDDEQLQFLRGITRHPLGTNTKEKSIVPLPVTSNGMQADEDTAIIGSKISQIKDLFPDYGKGFLAACLEVYNRDMEEVIQRILEGTLHEELQSLDISMEKVPPKSTPPMGKNDKGKGKLDESVVDLPKIVEPRAANDGSRVTSTSSSSLVGRFVRKQTDAVPDYNTLDSKNEKELMKTAALASQLEYEDEYDDSFDDLGLSVGDSGIGDDDSLMERVDSQHSRSSGTDGGSSGASAAKWNSRSKKPQFYVKDGKNYSYKVEGSVAAANYNEAALVNQAQKELIHGLGQGGNIPLGAVQRFQQSNEEHDDEAADTDEVGGRGGRGNGRGRGRGRGGRNHYRRDKAMSKHLSGLPGRYNH